jgi:divalent metal cation (Fe/Co/Zn/Cd) transporter
MVEITLDRQAVAERGKRLEYFTIAWNSLEGLVAVIAGAFAGSISLVGFGIDSFIEVTSGAVLLWRMSVDADVRRRERNEKFSLRIVGVCFLALAAYVSYESFSDIVSRNLLSTASPELSWLVSRSLSCHFWRGRKRESARSLGVLLCKPTHDRRTAVCIYPPFSC